MATYSFPVERILYKVQQELPKAQTVGLLKGFENGLQNEINIVDRDGRATTIAEVSPNGQVTLSVSYCQFLLLMCHIGLIIHESIAVESELSSMSEENKKLYYKALEIDSPQTRYLRGIPSVEDAKKNCSKLIDTAMPLLQFRPISDAEFKAISEDVNYDSELACYANSLCVYGIIFILLHEASHVILGQELTQEGSIQEEINADHNAFWAMWGDLEGKERNSAMMGCLCALASFLFYNPSLSQDGIHPREDERLFSFYDILKDEKDSYTEMLVFLLITWATVFAKDNPDFPQLSDSYLQTLERQRAYFAK